METSRLTAHLPVEDAALLVVTARLVGCNTITTLVRAIHVFSALVVAENAGAQVVLTYPDGSCERLMVR